MTMHGNNFQEIGERLCRAGWATGFATHPDKIIISWTDKGLDGMENLYHCLDELGGVPFSVYDIKLLAEYAFLEAKRRGWQRK
jgi:hypothetical protein